MVKFLLCILLFLGLLLLSFHKNFAILIFFSYIPLFYAYETFDTLHAKRRIFFLIYGFTYMYFLIMFWWLRHISIYAPIFLSLPLAFFRTIALYIPFLSSLKFRHKRLLFLMIGGLLLEKLLIASIYPQPYLSANQIFATFAKLSRPILLNPIIYQDIFIILISYSLYSLVKIFFFKMSLYNIEKLNILFISLIIFLLLCLNFYFNNKQIKNQNPLVETLKVAILQPNIPQEIKNESTDYAQFIMNKILSQITSVKKSREKIDIIIGPETIFPFVVRYKNEAYRYLKKLRKKVGIDLILGGFWEDTNNNIFNAVFLVTRASIRVYKKVQLVLFGEYLPLGNVGFIRKIYDTFLPTKNFEELKSANKFRIFNHKGIKIQVLVCFEGFLETSYKNKNVDFYINLSNEGWYKDGQELYWAWKITKAFSVFTQTPIIRATNTGISGIHYPDGNSKALEKKGSLINFDGVFIDELILDKKDINFLSSLIYYLLYIYILIYILIAILYGIVILVIIISLIIFRIIGRFKF